MIVEKRVEQLLSDCSDDEASPAYLLCDRHEPTKVAATIVASDLSSVNISYGELREESERLASALWQRGLRPGDRIATLMGKSRQYLVTVVAIWRLGAVHIPLFTAFAPQAIAQRVVPAGCKLIFCDASQRAKLVAGAHMPAEPPWETITLGEADNGSLSFDQVMLQGEPGFESAALGGEAPLALMFTSGTTGNPKGIEIPVRAIASFQAYLDFGLDVRADDVYWDAADPGWGYGLYYAIIGPLASGIRTILWESAFSPEGAYAILSCCGVTNFAAAPTVYRSLRASGLTPPEDLKLRCASSAGEPLTPDVNEWAASALGVSVHDHYGQSETGMTINNHHHPALKKPLKTGSMGHSMPGWSAEILKEDADEPAAVGERGRVAFEVTKSPLAWFYSYLGEPEKTAERFSSDGRWYITGDVGRRDEDGYFYFGSRDDDVIIMAGYRIGPFEVESVLASHPAVMECAVVAAPDELRGEVLEAFVVLNREASPSDDLAQELKECVKRDYAAHAYPRQIHFTESLPKTPSGKVQRFELRKRLRESR